MKKLIAVSMILTMLFSVTGLQAAKKINNPWRECGIGAMIFPGKDVGVWAIISNVTWDLGTTAVSSALSSPDSCEGKALASAIFIDQTYEKLAEETAIGNGEHLAALYESTIFINMFFISLFK